MSFLVLIENHIFTLIFLWDIRLLNFIILPTRKANTSPVIPAKHSASRNPCSAATVPWIPAPAKYLPGQAITRQNDGYAAAVAATSCPL